MARSWLSFFGLGDASRFHTSLQAAALFHDIGKANHGFQSAVQPVGGDHGASTGQLIRHEHLSGLILCHQAVVDWTSARNDIDWDVVLGAVISHHCKVADPTVQQLRHSFAELIAGRQEGQVELLSQEDDFTELLRDIARELELSSRLPNLPAGWHWRT